MEPRSESTILRGLRRGRSVLALTLLPPLWAVSVPVQGQEASTSEQSLQTTGKKKFRKRQNRPIKMGTSGGNLLDLTPLECCDGTLGALIEKNGVQYVLSNNHVLARSNKGKPGEAIIQPGLGDQRPICEPLQPDADTVAFLTARKRVKFGLNRRNKIDAAIAEVVPGAVDPQGAIMGIGVPGSNTVEAFVGMRVKKSGRTTGLTRGSVIAVNASAVVDFPKRCGSDDVRVARFEDLIFIAGNNDKPFIEAGDSGSMVYENSKNCPGPVGLVFAGNEELAAASPAETVRKIAGKLGPKGQARFVGCDNSLQSASDRLSSATSTHASTTASISRPVIDKRAIDRATAVMRRRHQDLWRLRSVHGVGIGLSLEGAVEPAIYVFSTESAEKVRQQLPESLDGYRVEVFQSGRLVAR